MDCHSLGLIDEPMSTELLMQIEAILVTIKTDLQAIRGSVAAPPEKMVHGQCPCGCKILIESAQ